MSDQKKLVPGLRFFAPHPSAPDFVIGSVIISIKELVRFCNDNPELMSEYNGEPQLKLKQNRSQKGDIYFIVDDFKPAPRTAPQAPQAPSRATPPPPVSDSEDGLPF
jgi:hypothetical protein